MQPDFLYDPDDWEVTWVWEDRADAAEHAEIRVGEFKRFETLAKGPDRFAVEVVLKRDDDGNCEESQLRWFDTEAEARAACAR